MKESSETTKPKEKTSSTGLDLGRAVIYASVLTVLMCAASVFLKLYSEHDLLIQSFAVVLGVIITAVITMLLLRAQSNTQQELQIELHNMQTKAEEARERERREYEEIQKEKDRIDNEEAANRQAKVQADFQERMSRLQNEAERKREIDQKVYEEKLKIYQDFLMSLRDVLEDGKIDEAEKNKLIFQTASITVHTSLKHVAEISRGVNALVQTTNDLSSDEAKIVKDKMDALFCIVNSFRQELYTKPEDREKEWLEERVKTQPQESSAESDVVGAELITYANEVNHRGSREVRESIKDAFAGAFEVLADDGATSGTIASISDAEGISSWAEACERWEQRGWVLTDKSRETGGYLEFEIRKHNIPACVTLGFHDGHYYFQGNYEGSNVFSRDIKRRYKKGKRTYGAWWYHFEGEYYEMPPGTFSQRVQNDLLFLKYVFSSINIIFKHLQEQHEVLSWWKGVQERMKANHPEWLGNDMWYMESYDLIVFYCDYKNADEGTPFMDVYRDEDGASVIIELYNRRNDENLLRHTLSRLSDAPDEQMKKRTPNNRGVLLKRVRGEQNDENVRQEVVEAIVGYMSRLAS